MDGIAALRGRRVLIVEDDYLVAQTVAALLEEAGATVFGPIGSVEEAIAFVNDGGETLDCAVLDVSLHRQKSYPIADALLARRIGVVFATGYGADGLEPGYQHFPRCEKPFTLRALMAALETAIG